MQWVVIVFQEPFCAGDTLVSKEIPTLMELTF